VEKKSLTQRFTAIIKSRMVCPSSILVIISEFRPVS
jgi:hypothetical protein